MKTRLPKTLLIALLAAASMSSTSHAKYVATSGNTIVQETSAVLTAQQKEILSSSTFAGTSNEAPLVVAKDGQGELIVSESITMYNPLVVREGKVTLRGEGVVVENYTNLNNGVCNLLIGGNNASMEITDGAKYIQSYDFCSAPNSSVAIGSGDGSGNLTVTNASSFRTDHCTFIGYNSAEQGYVSHTLDENGKQYANPNPETAAGGMSKLTVSGGSTYSTGQWSQFANADITITGKDSAYHDGTRELGGGGYYSYLAATENSTTNLTIADGATFDTYHNILSGYGENSATTITVKGENSKFIVRDDRWTFLGGYEGSGGQGEKATTVLTVTDGGSASLGTAWLGGVTTVDITVGKDSSVSTTYLYASDKVTITNNGSITAPTLDLYGSKLVLGEGSSLSAGTVTVASGSTIAVEAGGSTAPITITDGGSITDSADATFEVSMGKGVNTNADLNSSDTDCNDAGITYTVISGAAVDMKSKLVAATENATGIWESVGEAAWTKDETAKTTGITTKVRMVQDVVVSEDMALNMNITDMEDGTKRSLTVKDAKVELNGANSYTGNTTINGEKAVLKLGSANALGSSVVYLQNKGTLDLSGFAVANTIYVEGCTLSGGANYAGDMYVSGNLSLTEATKANSVTMSGAGTISDECLHTNKLTVEDNATGEISSDLVMEDNSTITIGANTKLVVSGSMTLGSGIQVIVDESFQNGDVVIDYTGSGADLSNTPLTLVTPSGQEVSFVITGDQVILNMNPYSQLRTDILAQGNWGIAMASRAFVNAVQGQHNNMGCIANGRGTVWAGALFGDYSIDGSGAKSGSDISMHGAVVGADMKVGKRSNVGIALGYTDSEISLDTKPHKVDQEGTYVAVYGDHGLRKLSDKSCLSFNWVAAYGNTESSFRSTDWEQDHVQINGRLNWNRKVTDRLCMNVFGGLEYFASESGTVDDGKSGSIQNLRGEVGVGAAYVAWGTPDVTDGKGGLVSHGCKRLVLHGELSYYNDIVRSNPIADVHGYRGTGANPGRQGFGAKAGATYRFGQRWSASANYSFNAMDDANEHNVNVGAAYTF